MGEHLFEAPGSIPSADKKEKKTCQQSLLGSVCGQFENGVERQKQPQNSMLQLTKAPQGLLKVRLE